MNKVLLGIITVFIVFFNQAVSQSDSSIVDLYGQLQVKGSQIVDQNDNPIALHGMSLFWSQWIGKYYNYDCIKWLRDDWKCTVVRAAMGIESGGYLSNSDTEMARIVDVVDACIDLGIYVIIDWHDHHAENFLLKWLNNMAKNRTSYMKYTMNHCKYPGPM